ncbi:MAG TPA: DMT family transporter [Acidimicrobiia bacterium]|nr:DMT family transporter [Acidimicrobiia bacterium]
MFAARDNRAILALLGASFLFGATFVVVKSALDEIEPLGFIAWRFAIGAAVLAILAIPRGKALWLHGFLAGLALFAGYALQTSGLVFTSASNSALITGLYVVMTPFLATLFSRRAPSPWVVTGAAAAFGGVALLTGLDGSSLGRGDVLTLGCALAFATHIVVLARYARQHPVIPFTTVQLLVTAGLSLLASWRFEAGPGIPDRSVWGALALTGIGVTVGAFLLQVWAQTVVGSATAAIVLSAEPAFGVATAWVVLGERLSLRGWVGAALIVAAIYVVVTKQRDHASREAEAVTPAH